MKVSVGLIFACFFIFFSFGVDPVVSDVDYCTNPTALNTWCDQSQNGAFIEFQYNLTLCDTETGAICLTYSGPSTYTLSSSPSLLKYFPTLSSKYVLDDTGINGEYYDDPPQNVMQYSSWYIRFIVNTDFTSSATPNLIKLVDFSGGDTDWGIWWLNKGLYVGYPPGLVPAGVTATNVQCDSSTTVSTW